MALSISVDCLYTKSVTILASLEGDRFKSRAQQNQKQLSAMENLKIMIGYKILQLFLRTAVDIRYRAECLR